jgi:hypothetical protein
MFYQIQILLIIILLILGGYELLQLTPLGNKLLIFVGFSMKWLHALILTKKARRNIYKYQQQ